MLLESYVKSCKISKEACDELVSNLEKQGVKVKISDEITPDITCLPIVFSNDDTTDDENLEIT